MGDMKARGFAWRNYRKYMLKKDFVFQIWRTKSTFRLVLRIIMSILGCISLSVNVSLTDPLMCLSGDGVRFESSVYLRIT